MRRLVRHKACVGLCGMGFLTDFQLLFWLVLRLMRHKQDALGRMAYGAQASAQGVKFKRLTAHAAHPPDVKIFVKERGGWVIMQCVFLRVCFHEYISIPVKLQMSGKHWEGAGSIVQQRNLWQ